MSFHTKNHKTKPSYINNKSVHMSQNTPV